MRKKRIMVVGPTRSGKTTLVNELNGFSGKLKKTQDIIYGQNTIDVPGSYIENRWMYKHLITISQDASHILLLMDQSKSDTVYPPRFAQSFRCPVIGVISKGDLMVDNWEFCCKQLQQAGVLQPYYKVSVPKGIGLEALREKLFLSHKK